MTRTGQQQARGFTLFELLLAVAIFGIVLSAINTVFYSALRLRTKTAEAVDAAQGLNHALGVLRRDLLGVVPPGGVLAGQIKVGLVSPGTSTSVAGTGANTPNATSVATGLGSNSGVNQIPGIEFYTTTGVISDQAPWGDIQKVTYQLRPPLDQANAYGKELIRTVTRNLLATTVQEVEEQTLAANIDTIRFYCLVGTDWRETWDTTMGDVGMPSAIRVQLQLATEDRSAQANRQPLEMLVPLSAQLSTNSTQTVGGQQ